MLLQSSFMTTTHHTLWLLIEMPPCLCTNPPNRNKRNSLLHYCKNITIRGPL